MSVITQIDGSLIKFFEGPPDETYSALFHYHSNGFAC